MQTYRLSLVLLLLAGACQVRSPTVDDLRIRLWERAREVFDEQHAVLDQDARREIRDLVERGAAKLSEDHASAEVIHVAEHQMRKVAIDIVARAKRGGPGDKGIVEVLEKDVKAIRDKVCPLYPFCK